MKFLARMEIGIWFSLWLSCLLCTSSFWLPTGLGGNVRTLNRPKLGHSNFGILEKGSDYRLRNFRETVLSRMNETNHVPLCGGMGYLFMSEASGTHKWDRVASVLMGEYLRPPFTSVPAFVNSQISHIGTRGCTSSVSSSRGAHYACKFPHSGISVLDKSARQIRLERAYNMQTISYHTYQPRRTALSMVKREYTLRPYDSRREELDNIQFPEDIPQMEFFGVKRTMSNLFSPCGKGFAVTVIAILPMTILSHGAHGYCHVSYGKQIGERRFVKRPVLGQLSKNVFGNGSNIGVVRLRPPHLFLPGEIIDARYLVDSRCVAVTSTSKGKGFCGVIKRHGFKGGPASRGSRFHRRGGSIGTAGRQSVLPGTKMPGRMGGEIKRVVGLKVLAVNPGRNEIILKGSVPGNNKGIVKIHRYTAGEENNSRLYPILKINSNLSKQLGLNDPLNDEAYRITKLKQSIDDLIKDETII